MFQKILVPLDGSSSAEQALEKAVQLALLCQATVILARAQEYPRDVVAHKAEFPTLHSYYEEERKVCQEYLDKMKASLPSTLQVETRICSDESPARALLDLATEVGADLILTTSHGRTGMQRWLLGSVAEKLARLAPCPVMILRRQD